MIPNFLCFDLTRPSSTISTRWSISHISSAQMYFPIKNLSEFPKWNEKKNYSTYRLLKCFKNIWMAFGHLVRCFLMDGKLAPYLCVCAILSSSLGPGTYLQKRNFTYKWFSVCFIFTGNFPNATSFAILLFNCREIQNIGFK